MLRLDLRQLARGLNRIRGLRSKLVASLRDTNITPLSRLRRAWRILSRDGLEGPEPLSDRTDYLRDIKFRRLKGEQVPLFWEGFNRRLHRYHTIRSSTCLAGVTFAAIVALSIGYGLLLNGTPRLDPVLGLGSILTTVAEVVGAAAGILFAVIVFGLQFHGERLGEVSFLVRFLRRHEGLVPIAAFTLAVVAANVVVPLIGGLGLPHAPTFLAFADLFLVPVVLWLTLLLLYRMAVSVSESRFDTMLPGLTWEFEEALDEDIYYANQIAEYGVAGKLAGLEYSPVAHLLGIAATGSFRFKLRRRGCITDVTLAALNRLGHYVSSTCVGYEAKLCLAPGDNVKNEDALVLTRKRMRQDDPEETGEALTGETEKEIDRLLQGVYRFGRLRTGDVAKVLTDFTNSLVNQAKYARSDELERSFRVQLDLIRLRLKRSGKTEAPFSLYRDKLPDYLGHFEYHEMARAVIGEGDKDKIEALLRFAGRVMNASMEHANPSLYRHAGGIVESVYWAAENELADFVGKSIDDWLLKGTGHFEFLRSWDLEPESIAAQEDVLLSRLAWHIALVKCAIERERKADALNFHSRLFEWDRHGERYLARHIEDDVPAIMREVYDLHTYAELLIGAWCFHLSVGEATCHELATVVLKQALAQLGTREELLKTWEVLSVKRFHNVEIDDCLGVRHWGMPRPERTGITVTGFGGDEWITDGLYAALLSRPAAKTYEVPTYFDSPPPAQPLQAEDVKTRGESWLGDARIRGLLGIPEEQADERLQKVLKLLERRRRLWKLGRLRCVVERKIDRDRVVAFRNDMIERLDSERELFHALEKLGHLGEDATASVWPRVVGRTQVRKERLLQEPQTGACGFAGFEDHLAECVGSRESMEIAHLAENHAASVGRVESLAGIARMTEAAVNELRQSRYEPSVVFIPGNRRFVKALTGVASWRSGRRGDLGRYHLGEWNSCQLFRWPYDDCRSIAVVDASAFYGRCANSDVAAVELKIEDPWEKEHKEWLQAATNEPDPSKIRDELDLNVFATAEMIAGIGIRNPSAARQADIDLSRLGYGMQGGDELFHRPGCPALREDAKTEFSLLLQYADETKLRKPCKQCKPDDWDSETEEI